MQIVQDGAAITPWRSCDTLVHTIRNATYSDGGEYMCRGEAGDGSTFETPLGNMSVIGEWHTVSHAANYCKDPLSLHNPAE